MSAITGPLLRRHIEDATRYRTYGEAANWRDVVAFACATSLLEGETRTAVNLAWLCEAMERRIDELLAALSTPA